MGIDDGDSDKFKIAQNNTLASGVKFTIEEGGNIGIGTSSPQELLHVHGTSGNQRLEIEATTAEAILKITSGPRSWSWSTDTTHDHLKA